MRSPLFLLFVAITFCCWGVYGPLIHVGQAKMGAEGQLSSLRPFICVGIAYFLIAVIFPIFVLTTRDEQGHWNVSGIIWSFMAGVVGAIGALGIIMAFKFHGKPVYVMPIVFGCAPVVNTFVTMWMSRTVKNASLLFYIGVATVAIGAAGVLTFKPSPPKPAAPATSQTESKETTEKKETKEPQQKESQKPQSETTDNATAVADNNSNEKEQTSEKASQDSEASPTDQKNNETEPKLETEPKPETETDSAKEQDTRAGKVVTKATNLVLIFMFLCLTAICWGSYGPVLHKGQAKMGGSRLRPFLCVGIAYFAIAVLVPYFLMGSLPEPGGWSVGGTFWSLLAGGVGAVGALGIIYAFNFGGKPIFVMPLVFGFAPVINTFTETISKGLFDELSRWFYLSLLLVIIGATTVLLCAPRGKPTTKTNHTDTTGD